MGTLLKFAGRLLVALLLLAAAQFGAACALPEGGQGASAQGILSQAHKGDGLLFVPLSSPLGGGL